MLAEIDISNFAIIEHLHLQLHPGFNVLTGETGAGKSIIIDAVGTLLGGRAQSEFLRAGADQTRVEGVFTLDTNARDDVSPILDEVGVDHSEDTLIITREINREGRNICRINGRAVTLHTLQRIGQNLIDIHGQSEHLSLLRVREHVDFLDRYGNLWEQRARVADQVKSLRAIRNELKKLSIDQRELARRIDRLTYVVEEISQANLKPGEEEQLKQERDLLGNAELRANLADHAYRRLYGEGEDEKGAVDLFEEALNAIVGLAKYDPSLQELCEQAQGAQAQADDLARTLRIYRDSVDHNPARLEKVDERLDLIHQLKRKYGDTIEEIIAFGGNAATELAGISQSEQRTEDLRTQEATLLRTIASHATDLSRARKQAAERLAAEIEHELPDLGMAKSKFNVSFETSQEPDGIPIDGQRIAFDLTGIDRAEFLVSPNPGEPLKPLAKIASGGETSRLMLAMKSVLSMADKTPTLIFDEIDQGIGGRTGGIVGNKLWALTPTGNKRDAVPQHQVICVTHLPQIAAHADAHFRIQKEVVGERTVTRITQLDGNKRIDELAVMLGAATPTTRQSAQEMLRDTEATKQSAIPKTKADKKKH